MSVINTELKQKEYIKEYWGKKGQQKIMKDLNIGYKKFMKYVEELNLEKSQESAIQERLPDEKIKYIKKHYKKLGVKQVSEDLNCGESTVYKYAKKMKLTNSCLIWTKEEDEILKENINCYTIRYVQKLLKRKGYDRTEFAIIKRTKDLKIEKDITDGGYYFTTKEVSILMGFSISKINSLIRKGYLKGEKYNNKTRIDIKYLREFILDYQKYWDYKDVDKEQFHITFFDLNNNESLLKKIEIDKSSDRRKKEWTTKEESSLVNLIENNVDPKTICINYSNKRSKSSVLSKIFELKHRQMKDSF